MAFGLSNVVQILRRFIGHVVRDDPFYSAVLKLLACCQHRRRPAETYLLYNFERRWDYSGVTNITKCLLWVADKTFCRISLLPKESGPPRPKLKQSATSFTSRKYLPICVARVHNIELFLRHTRSLVDPLLQSGGAQCVLHKMETALASAKLHLARDTPTWAIVDTSALAVSTTLQQLVDGVRNFYGTEQRHTTFGRQLLADNILRSVTG